MSNSALSWRRVRALCVKETRQIVRDPSSWLIAVVIPLLLLFIFGYGINLDSSKLRVGILLEQQSEEALDFTHTMTGSPYIDATISDNRQELIEKMQGKVAEITCTLDDVGALQAEYKVGNIRQRKNGLALRLVGDILPKEAVPVEDNIDLEDVYLYYFE